jgi:Tol biopolymer transport system component
MITRRNLLSGLAVGALAAHPVATWAQPRRTKGTMLMNRIAPSSSQLFIADLDLANERPLLGAGAFDYNATLDARGKWLTFTSERRADGQSDIYRARADGTGIEPLVASLSVDDAGVLSPDGRTLAFVSTRDGYRANIWTMDLRTKRLRQLTGIGDVRGEEGKPDCYFRPQWSPDGKWIAFSSDRNTNWTGHDGGDGWEHTQELSIYMIRPDGTGLRQVASRAGYCLGSPKWSSDGKRIVFYEMTVEATWGARRPNYQGKAWSQIVSVDVASGARTVHTDDQEMKLYPQFMADGDIGYLIKNSPAAGIAYVSKRTGGKARNVRAPSWTPDGKSVIYERTAFDPVRPLFKPLQSWDADWDYRHYDVFPIMSKDGWIVFTKKQLGNSSIWIMRPDGSEAKEIFNPAGYVDQTLSKTGLVGAFQPAWSPDGEWITFGLGSWFFKRSTEAAAIWRIRRDGSGLERLTHMNIHSGFPSYSGDGKEIVFRVWADDEKGLRIINLDTRAIRKLTDGYDNLPGWSPDGKEIVFTRKHEQGNFDIFTIQPDGSNLKRLTTHGSSDGHAVWSQDNRILWSGSEHGFRDEAALYDMTFQQYGQIYVMNRDGSDKRLVTDSKWEDSMPLYLPGTFF